MLLIKNITPHPVKQNTPPLSTPPHSNQNQILPQYSPISTYHPLSFTSKKNLHNAWYYLNLHKRYGCLF